MAGTNFASGVKSRGVPVEGLGRRFPLIPNDIWYVDGTNGDDTNSGKSSGDAFATIEQAITSSAARDVIIIEPGTYAPATADLPLTPKANQLFLASVYNPKPNVIITDDGGGSDTDLVDIEVDNVYFEGIRFEASHADVARLVKVADTANVVGLTFEHCWFNADGNATVNGISAVDGTFSLKVLRCVDCRFRDTTIGIAVGVLGFEDSVVEHNVFDLRDVGGGDVGLNLADTSAALTGYGFVVRDNDFIGPSDGGNDAVGIVVAGTEDTTAYGMIRENFFAYCTAAAITIDKIPNSTIRNYVGDVGTGGTLVDPGS